MHNGSTSGSVISDGQTGIAKGMAPWRGCCRHSLRFKAMVITGPTATRKSDVAVEVAKEVGGEIISIDSYQVRSSKRQTKARE